jgi:hypothetical protein
MRYLFAPTLVCLSLVALLAVAGTSIDSSQTQNNTIRDETSPSANTALRIGNALNGILEAATLELSAQSADFTAVAGFVYPVDSSGGAITVTAPSLPDTGDIFAVCDQFGTWATNNVTVGFGILSLHNQVTPNNLYIGNANYAYRAFRYDGVRWIIIP